MAAYAALISLENTIHRILNHHLFSISLPEKQQIISLLHHVNSFQGSLEEFPNKFDSLEGRMRKLAHEAEDILEYLVLEKVSSSSDDQREFHLETVMAEIGLISMEVVKIKGSSSSEEVQGAVDSSAGSSSSSERAPPIRKDYMVGFGDYMLHVKERLCGEQSEFQVIPICGMGGIGKTTLAKNVYDDQLIKVTFDIRVWVTVSQNYTTQRILSSLFDSLKKFDTGGLGNTYEERVRKILKFRKYLVVMDDIWSGDAWDVVKNVFPDDGNGSRVLLTTRLSDVASYPDSPSKLCEMHLMNADQSWILFKKRVFGDEDCPSELENIGKEIVQSCKGLPLAIVVIAGVVSTVNRNFASWNEIGKNVKSVGQKEVEDILCLSYFQLPQYLKPCFLYMGSFPEDEEINVMELIRLWVAEGFLKSPMDSHNFEKLAEECLEELAKRNLVLVTKRKWDGRIRSCGLHDMMRDLCIRKACESKFFLNLMDRNMEKESLIENIRNQRRLNVHHFHVKHLSSCNNSTIHSIKCSQYDRVQLDFLDSVKLLRVLDAKKVYLKKSTSMEKLPKLFHLRYLAVSCSTDIPIGSWNLQNLQTLIIHTDLVTVKLDDLCLAWCMPHLRHVYYPGAISFSDPKETTCSLGSLQTVSYISHKSCTERILKKIPNLKKLKVECSGGFFDHGKDACLNDLVNLQRLEILELYSRWRKVRVQPKFYTSNLPKMMLKKLILRNLVLPLEYFIVVGWLPNLQVLKIKGCTCLCGSWETTEGGFPQLEFLLIENFDFTSWITESSHFPKLRRLSVSDCWHLDEIPIDIGEISTLELIEITGSIKESLVKSAQEMQNEQENLGNDTLRFRIARQIWTQKIS